MSIEVQDVHFCSFLMNTLLPRGPCLCLFFPGLPRRPTFMASSPPPPALCTHLTGLRVSPPKATQGVSAFPPLLGGLNCWVKPPSSLIPMEPRTVSSEQIWQRIDQMFDTNVTSNEREIALSQVLSKDFICVSNDKHSP